MTKEKENGIYYTPKQLAGFAASIAISSSAQSILDPSYGEGALLLSARDRLLSLGSRNPDSQLFGFDILPPKNGVIEAFNKGHLNSKHLLRQDFFSVLPSKPGIKYDIILTNPPFVRHHLIPKDTISTLRAAHTYLNEIPKTSDYYSYFLLVLPFSY